MGKINWARVILGGLLAGLIINIGEFLLNTVVLADQMMAAMQALGKGGEGAGGSIAVWVIYAFVLGIASIWLYAAIRPRYGPGVQTAICAGFTVWFFSSLMPTVAMINLELFPTSLMVYAVIWSLVEICLATVAGSWVYQETF